MRQFLVDHAENSIGIRVLGEEGFLEAAFSDKDSNWLKQHSFTGKSGEICFLQDDSGFVKEVVVGDPKSAWELGGIVNSLPAGNYKFLDTEYDASITALSWALSQYKFNRYLKSKEVQVRRLQVANLPQELYSFLESAQLVRDMVNTPAADLNPVDLSEQALAIAKKFSAEAVVIVGDMLLEKGFPAIHAVGRAAPQPPRLVDIEWQMSKTDLPLVILVGKGVCFDTGGLDLKTSAGMLGMKKDMGGAANVLGLAYCIMQQALPIRLKVLLPIVENSIDSNAYRPGDIITMRDGSTVEITNTDAEGRMILADALTYGAEFEPDLMLDMATLTGAARVAVGTEISAAFTDDAKLHNLIIEGAKQWQDPVCFMPLYKPYKKMLKTKVADKCNAAKTGYAGAITAALFLQDFVKDSIPWVHFDIMAANNQTRAGRPEGGEAMGIRAIFYAIKNNFC